MPKIITALAIASLVALPLVSCSSPAEPACTVTPAGSHSSEIKVSGALGKQPDVTLPGAFDAKTTERSVVISGTGERVLSGQVASVKYAAYNAATGATLELSPGSSWSDAKFIVDEVKSFPGIYKSLNCSRVGDRIVSAVPPAELFGGLGVDMTAAGISATDTVVFVFDIESVAPAPTDSPSPTPTQSPESASLPIPVAWVDNVPKTDLSGGVPVVTLPNTAPAAGLELTVITEGTGAVVAAGSTVTVDYQGISWEKNSIFDQSYTRGEPSTFPVAGVIQGFAAAMVGQKSGATVLVTIPPKYAYGVGEINDKNLVGQTLVFLIQIRDVK